MGAGGLSAGIPGRMAEPAVRFWRWPGVGAAFGIGRWSFAFIYDKELRTNTPLSERHGTTKTWRVGPFALRRRGQIVYGIRPDETEVY